MFHGNIFVSISCEKFIPLHSIYNLNPFAIMFCAPAFLFIHALLAIGISALAIDLTQSYIRPLSPEAYVAQLVLSPFSA